MAAPVVPILFGGLIVWGIYRRIRRNIGRQQLRPRRIIVSLVIFLLLSLVLIGVSLQLPKLLLGIGGGLVLGILLGFVGLRLTKFETTEAGHFYTPDMRLGIALSLLFVGRMLYRFWALRNLSDTAHTPPPFQSALTFLVFGLIAGYYIVYYIGLLRHTRGKK
jgi:hypothetical protein